MDPPLEVSCFGLSSGALIFLLILTEQYLLEPASPMLLNGFFAEQIAVYIGLGLEGILHEVLNVPCLGIGEGHSFFN